MTAVTFAKVAVSIFMGVVIALLYIKKKYPTRSQNSTDWLIASIVLLCKTIIVILLAAELGYVEPGEELSGLLHYVSCSRGIEGTLPCLQ